LRRDAGGRKRLRSDPIAFDAVCGDSESLSKVLGPNVALLAGGLAFSFAMGLFGGFFPAFRAARLKITTALRKFDISLYIVTLSLKILF
jgi:hypothetical protein